MAGSDDRDNRPKTPELQREELKQQIDAARSLNEESRRENARSRGEIEATEQTRRRFATLVARFTEDEARKLADEQTAQGEHDLAALIMQLFHEGHARKG